MPTRKSRPNEGHPTSVDACLTIDTMDGPDTCPDCEDTGEIAVFDGQTMIAFPCGGCRTYWEDPTS